MKYLIDIYQIFATNVLDHLTACLSLFKRKWRITFQTLSIKCFSVITMQSQLNKISFWLTFCIQLLVKFFLVPDQIYLLYIDNYYIKLILSNFWGNQLSSDCLDWHSVAEGIYWTKPAYSVRNELWLAILFIIVLILYKMTRLFQKV